MVEDLALVRLIKSWFGKSKTVFSSKRKHWIEEAAISIEENKRREVEFNKEVKGVGINLFSGSHKIKKGVTFLGTLEGRYLEYNAHKKDQSSERTIQKSRLSSSEEGLHHVENTTTAKPTTKSESQSSSTTESTKTALEKSGTTKTVSTQEHNSKATATSSKEKPHDAVSKSVSSKELSVSKEIDNIKSDKQTASSVSGDTTKQTTTKKEQSVKSTPETAFSSKSTPTDTKETERVATKATTKKEDNKTENNTASSTSKTTTPSKSKAVSETTIAQESTMKSNQDSKALHATGKESEASLKSSSNTKAKAQEDLKDVAKDNRGNQQAKADKKIVENTTTAKPTTKSESKRDNTTESTKTATPEGLSKSKTSTTSKVSKSDAKASKTTASTPKSVSGEKIDEISASSKGRVEDKGKKSHENHKKEHEKGAKSLSKSDIDKVLQETEMKMENAKAKLAKKSEATKESKASKAKSTKTETSSSSVPSVKPGSKLEAKLTKYIADVKKHYGKVDEDFLAIIVKNLGPSIYNKDAEGVACSDPKELDTVRKNFLIKKLGMTESQEVLDKAISEVCVEMKASRNKYRATFYYALAKKFKKESKLS